MLHISTCLFSSNQLNIATIYKHIPIDLTRGKGSSANVVFHVCVYTISVLNFQLKIQLNKNKNVKIKKLMGFILFYFNYWILFLCRYIISCVNYPFHSDLICNMHARKSFEFPWTKTFVISFRVMFKCEYANVFSHEEVRISVVLHLMHTTNTLYIRPNYCQYMCVLLLSTQKLLQRGEQATLHSIL